MGISSRASRQRGNVVLYLLFSLVASIAAGYAVYVLIRDRKTAVADDEVREPPPAPRPARPEPMTPVPVDEPPQDEPPPLDSAERDARSPDVVDPAKDAVLLGVPGVAGALEPAAVERTIKRYSVRYERCLRRAKERGATPNGELRLTFVIAADGNVDYATGKATNVDDELASCVLDVVNKLRFDRPADGAKVKVVYPFGFVTARASDDPLDR